VKIGALPILITGTLYGRSSRLFPLGGQNRLQSASGLINSAISKQQAAGMASREDGFEHRRGTMIEPPDLR
jgi:hypothetical protein